jgi:hypothetical protein
MEQEGIVHVRPSNARETKSVLRELLGGDIMLMASDDQCELVVFCALSDAKLPLTNRWPTRNVQHQQQAQRSGRNPL